MNEPMSEREIQAILAAYRLLLSNGQSAMARDLADFAIRYCPTISGKLAVIRAVMKIGK